MLDRGVGDRVCGMQKMLGISRMRTVQILKWELSGSGGFGCWIEGLRRDVGWRKCWECQECGLYKF